MSKWDLHPKKILLIVHGIIHWKVLKTNQAINVALYRLQLDRLWSALNTKSRVVDLYYVFLHPDNANSKALSSLIKKERDLVRRFYTIFTILLTVNCYLLCKTILKYLRLPWWCKNCYLRLFNSKFQVFCWCGIHPIPERWQEVLNSNGEYVQS